MSRFRTTTRLVVAATATTLVAGLVASATGTAAPASPASRTPDHRPPAQVDAPVPKIRWSGCQGMRCATARVPLDYDRPRGRTIRIGLLKRPADNQQRKIGTLFVNPGGPGGSATEFASYADQLFPKVVLRRFDVVGIDPRGVQQSLALVCRSDRQSPQAPLFPMNQRQMRQVNRYDTWLRQACRSSNPRILDHMSTADTARDMDLVRQALGDSKITYYGVSYGSILGSTYANMFPGRVRALIVDGVLDPKAWYTGHNKAERKIPSTQRIGSGKGAWEAWTTALSVCDRVSAKRCALTERPHAKWDMLYRKAKQGTLTDGVTRISPQDLTGYVLGSMYTRADYRPAMRALQQLWKANRGTASRADRRAAASAWRGVVQRVEEAREPNGPYGAGFDTDRRRAKQTYDPFHGVLCSDTINPKRSQVWARWSRKADRISPWFGRSWLWSSSSCARWPGSGADAYRGPFNRRTSTPIVITGNLHDPATPVTGARRLNQLMPGSRLITLDTWGHGALDASACVDKAWANYLVHRKLPRGGLVCRPDKALFPKR